MLIKKCTLCQSILDAILHLVELDQGVSVTSPEQAGEEVDQVDPGEVAHDLPLHSANVLAGESQFLASSGQSFGDLVHGCEKRKRQSKDANSQTLYFLLTLVKVCCLKEDVGVREAVDVEDGEGGGDVRDTHARAGQPVDHSVLVAQGHVNLEPSEISKRRSRKIAQSSKNLPERPNRPFRNLGATKFVD